MLLLKKGYPEEDELVFCTVSDIQYHCVFAQLDEYLHKKGMIHISEIASGRIRNTREYVKEGKKIVCKVLRVNLEKGHIDLSLRRVNEAQRRGKITEIKQGQAAEKIVEFVAKQQKKSTTKMFDEVYGSVSKKYDALYDCFEDVVAGKTTLEKLGVEKKLAQELTTIIKQRVKPPEIHLGGEVSLVCYESDGIDRIKKVLDKAKTKNVFIKYSGAGIYNVDVKGEEPKKTEKELKKSLDALSTLAKKEKILVGFTRKDIS